MSKASQRLERISAEEFKRRVKENPAWAKNLAHPVIVYEYANMRGSNIEYLSRWLRFSGKDPDGECASFIDCKNLINAEGTYDGSVDFSKSGVRKIGRIKVLGVDRQSWSAYFYKCANLKKISGEYLGPVAAAESGVKEIKNLRITKHNRDKEKLDLSCTEVSKIDDYSAAHLNENQIVWDEHIDDPYIKKIAQALQNIRERKEESELAKNRDEEIKAHNHSFPNQQNRRESLLDHSKKTIVRTIAQAIGADDVLAQQQVPITSPKRRRLLKVSTLLATLAALFLYKTTDELTKQVVIDPTVNALRRAPELVVNWIDPKEKIGAQTIWPNEFTPALERYAKSQKSEEDKIALAKDTILVMGLKPEALIIETDPKISRYLEINNIPTPISIGGGHSLGGYLLVESLDILRNEKNAELASSAYQCLSAFEEMTETFKKSEIEIKGLDKDNEKIENVPQNSSVNSQKSQKPRNPQSPQNDLNIRGDNDDNKQTTKRKSMSLPIALGID